MDMASEDFIRMQKWFREHPELLWATYRASETELIRQLAVRMAEPFEAANHGVEYGALADHLTDSVIMKVYRRDDVHDRDFSLAMIIPRKAIREGNVEGFIRDGWEALSLAVSDEKCEPCDAGETVRLSQIRDLLRPGLRGGCC